MTYRTAESYNDSDDIRLVAIRRDKKVGRGSYSSIEEFKDEE